MENKTVFVISSGCIYEGGGFLAVFSDYEKARARTLLSISEREYYNTEIVDYDGMAMYPPFKEVRPNEWENEYDYFIITEIPLL